MAPKTERFELRLDEDILARIDKWRGDQDDLPSRAEAMRRLVEAGLARNSTDTIRLSDGEKLLAMMMSDISKHLKIKNGIDPDFIQEVITGGHYWAPRWEMSGLYHDHVDDPRDVDFVIDVLDMWSRIEEAYKKLSTKEKTQVEKNFGGKLGFIGFDGNNESELRSIAHFLIEKMERFTEFKGRIINSHSRTRAMYQRMLDVFEPLREKVGMELNADQIIQILTARYFRE
jgi:uncharacterized protein